MLETHVVLLSKLLIHRIKPEVRTALINLSNKREEGMGEWKQNKMASADNLTSVQQQYEPWNV